MRPAIKPIAITKGITFDPLQVVCYDTNSTIVDLTGWTVYGSARKTPGEPVAFALSPVITDAPGGEITIEFTAAETSAFPVGFFEYDIVLEKPDGVRIGPLMAGPVSVVNLNSDLP